MKYISDPDTCPRNRHFSEPTPDIRAALALVAQEEVANLSNARAASAHTDGVQVCTLVTLALAVQEINVVAEQMTFSTLETERRDADNHSNNMEDYTESVPIESPLSQFAAPLDGASILQKVVDHTTEVAAGDTHIKLRVNVRTMKS